MHSRGVYNALEAAGVFKRVYVFMERLSSNAITD